MNELPLRGKKKSVNCRINGYDPDELLNEFEAAEFLGLSVYWLRMSRLTKPKWAGPKFVRPDGYHVRYDRNHLTEFVATRNGGPRVVDPADRMRKTS